MKRSHEEAFGDSGALPSKRRCLGIVSNDVKTRRTSPMPVSVRAKSQVEVPRHRYETVLMVNPRRSSVPKITISLQISDATPTTPTTPTTPDDGPHEAPGPKEPDLLWPTWQSARLRKVYQLSEMTTKKRKSTEEDCFLWLETLIKPSTSEYSVPDISTDNDDNWLDDNNMGRRNSPSNSDTTPAHDAHEGKTNQPENSLAPILGPSGSMFPEAISPSRKRSLDSLFDDEDADSASHSGARPLINNSNCDEQPADPPPRKKSRTDPSSDGITYAAYLLTEVSALCKANPRPCKDVVKRLQRLLEHLPEALTEEGRMKDPEAAEIFMLSLIDHENSSHWGSLYAFEDLRKRLQLMWTFSDPIYGPPQPDEDGVFVL